MEKIEIYMQSGKSKRRNNDTYLVLTVTDPYTESFPDCPNGNEDGGYRIYT